MSYFMKTAESHSALITMNMSTSSEYAEKRRNIIYAQHQIMIIRYVVFEKCQQDINMLIIIKITQYELQNVTREKNM